MVSYGSSAFGPVLGQNVAFHHEVLVALQLFLAANVADAKRHLVCVESFFKKPGGH